MFCCICALLALNQNQLGQLLVILSAGGIALTFGIPYFFGVYWKKATAHGAFSSCIVGIISYVLFYKLSAMQWYKLYFHHINALIPAAIITILTMIIVSLFTQNKKVPLGVYRVWFCREYTEKYTNIYNSCDFIK